MIISARPFPSIKSLFSNKSYNFDSNKFEFYFLGREALLNSMLRLGLQPGDSIIIPAYMCSSSVKPLESYGFNLILIDVDRNLSLPISRIKNAIMENKVKALIMVHYFGYTQKVNEIVNICNKFQVKVVEDASHSFLSQISRDRNCSNGDVEIFSMRKNFPISDGGALKINFKTEKFINSQSNVFFSLRSDLIYLFFRLIEKIFSSLGVNIYSEAISRIKNQIRSNYINQESHTKPDTARISWQLNQYLNDQNYLINSHKKINQNFRQLSKALIEMKFKLFIDSIEDNVAPQVCIIQDNKGGLVKYLRSKGIGAWRWPDKEILSEVVNSPDQFPNSIFFDKNLALLPIHQSLTNKQIKYMIHTLSNWKL